MVNGVGIGIQYSVTKDSVTKDSVTKDSVDRLVRFKLGERPTSRYLRVAPATETVNWSYALVHQYSSVTFVQLTTAVIDFQSRYYCCYVHSVKVTLVEVKQHTNGSVTLKCRLLETRRC